MNLPGKVALGVGAFFLLVNLLTADRSPTVWQDEVMFLDPAANLAAGQGFRTTFWNWQSPDRIFTANSPLYSLLLAGWVAMGVVDPGWVRSLNFFLALGMVGILGAILASQLSRPQERSWRLGLFYFLALGWGSIAFSYRSGRYDMLCGLLFALVAFGASRGSRAGLGLAIVAAWLCPWAGLQTMVVLGVGILVAGLVWKKEGLMPAGAIGLAACGGLFSLVLWAWSVGGLQTFINSVRSLGGQAPASLVSFGTGMFRWDWALAVAVCLGLSVGRFQSFRPVQIWALAMGVLLPVVFGLLGKYPIYYSFFSILPLLFVICSVEMTRQFVIGAWLLCASVVVTGLPARLGLVALEWRQRSPAILTQGLAGVLKTGEAVLTDYPYYYAVRAIGARAYGPPMAQRKLPSSIQAIVSYPGDPLEKFAQEKQWTLQSVKDPEINQHPFLPSARMYAWRVYRRPANPPQPIE